MLKQKLEQDLKEALLSGDKDRATVIRGLKSVILYAEVAQGVRDKGLSDEEVTVLMAKEAKKRQESADLYVQGGSQERADAELSEKAIIEAYLPKQLSDEELRRVVEDVISQTEATGPQAMGQIIGAVKQKVGSTAEGSRIAQLVKERL